MNDVLSRKDLLVASAINTTDNAPSTPTRNIFDPAVWNVSVHVQDNILDYGMDRRKPTVMQTITDAK